MLASDNTSLNPAKIFLSVKLFENLVKEVRDCPFETISDIFLFDIVV